MRQNSRFDVLLSALAALFLAAYAWPILDPGLPGWGLTACRVVIVGTWVVFAVDYARRLLGADDRSRWFWRHLPDLLILVLPLLRPLRLLRLVTLLTVLTRSGATTLRGRVGLYVVSGALMLAFVAALAALDAERGAPDATIDSFGDALWWAITTMSTVGYGDTFPVTTTGRVVAVGLMIGGIALLGTVTATIASWLVDSVSQEVIDAAAEDDAAQGAELRALRHEIASLRADLGSPRPLD